MRVYTPEEVAKMMDVEMPSKSLPKEEVALLEMLKEQRGKAYLCTALETTGMDTPLHLQALCNLIKEGLVSIEADLHPRIFNKKEMYRGPLEFRIVTHLESEL